MQQITADTRKAQGHWEPGYYRHKCEKCEALYKGGLHSKECANCAYLVAEELVDMADLAAAVHSSTCYNEPSTCGVEPEPSSSREPRDIEEIAPSRGEDTVTHNTRLTYASNDRSIFSMACNKYQYDRILADSMRAIFVEEGVHTFYNGDLLKLEEVHQGVPTGTTQYVKVTYVVRDSPAMRKGYTLLSIQRSARS